MKRNLITNSLLLSLALLSLYWVAGVQALAKTVKPLRPLTAAVTPLTQSETDFTFIAMGDSRPPLPHMPLPTILRDIMREVTLLRPAFVLYNGDTMWGYGDTRQELLNELDRFRALANSMGVPLFNAPGNHDMQSDPAAVEIIKEQGQDLYGSFDVGRYHFIALNTDEVNLERRITGEQMEWLKSDLEMNKMAAGIFVAMHRPLFSSYRGDFDPEDRDALHALFRRYHVKAVFAGHDHFYHEEDRDGVHYVTTAGAGAPLYLQPQSGGFSHYVVVSISANKVDYIVVEPHHLEVTYTAGNDGLEPISTARVMSTLDRNLVARNLQFHAPRLSSRSLYRITTDLRDEKGQKVDLPATLRDVVDMHDGSVTVSVEVMVPAGSGFYVTVEAREPAKRLSAHGPKKGGTLRLRMPSKR
ncbi:MAG: metallophosphoesterase [Acidobacteriota bacterium]|nr:metallophosphoesterase [Acidobacteriota bacterium]